MTKPEEHDKWLGVFGLWNGIRKIRSKTRKEHLKTIVDIDTDTFDRDKNVIE